MWMPSSSRIWMSGRELAGRQRADHGDDATDVVVVQQVDDVVGVAHVQRRQPVDRGEGGVAHDAAHPEAGLGVLAQHRHEIRGVGVHADDDDVTQVMTGRTGGAQPGPVAAAEPQQQHDEQQRAGDQPARLDRHAHDAEQQRLDDAEHDRRTHDATDLLGAAGGDTRQVQALELEQGETARDEDGFGQKPLPDLHARGVLPHLCGHPCDDEGDAVEHHQPPPEVANFEFLGAVVDHEATHFAVVWGGVGDLTTGVFAASGIGFDGSMTMWADFLTST